MEARAKAAAEAAASALRGVRAASARLRGKEDEVFLRMTLYLPGSTLCQGPTASASGLPIIECPKIMTRSRSMLRILTWRR